MVEGPSEGILDGEALGTSLGAVDGLFEGSEDGCEDGWEDGCADGTAEGVDEGSRLGTALGELLGACCYMQYERRTLVSERMLLNKTHNYHHSVAGWSYNAKLIGAIKSFTAVQVRSTLSQQLWKAMDTSSIIAKTRTALASNIT